jgi:hypothetical protein
MTPESRAHMIYEQSLIIEFAGDEAITALADLLKDPVDRYRALNLVLDVAGPIEQMDAATIAMFKRFQLVLLTLAYDWREPAAADAPAAIPAAGEMQDRPHEADAPPDDGRPSAAQETAA